MDDRARITELIDRTVRDAKIEDIREREGLRRELESHFADAADSPPAVAAVKVTPAGRVSHTAILEAVSAPVLATSSV